MAHRRWVVNASPLILLGKTGHLGLLGVLTNEVAVPRAVVDEVGAKAMGLGIIGTLGVVGRARAMGLIDQAEPVVKRLRETGLYVSDDLVRRLLKEVGE